MLTTTTLTVLTCVTVGFGWLYAIVFLLLAIENRRFWRARDLQTPPCQIRYPRCLVVIPCKGMEHNLRENLSSFLRQDYPNYEVAFVVEDKDDPAVRTIQILISENRCVQSRLVVAGRSENAGQKVHNLRAATGDLAPEIEFLVFADSDSVSKGTWLRWLTGGLGKPGTGARTGYRWMIPLNKKLPTLIGCSLNNAVASMFGPGGHFLVWGGSWAIKRAVFDGAGLRQAWCGVLSDDLVASRVLRLNNLKINFEPQSVCTCRISFTWKHLIEFVSRQLIISRFYAPGYWALALLTTLFSQLAYWGGLLGGGWLVYSGNSIGWWLLASSAGLHLTSALRSLLRGKMGRMMSSEWPRHRRAKRFDSAAAPVYGLFLLAMMAYSSIANKIVWRRIGYHISRGGRILLLGRKIQNPQTGPNKQERPQKTANSTNTTDQQASPSTPTLPAKNRRAA